jgi:hypothetical protein
MPKVKPLFRIADIRDSIIQREKKKIDACQTKDLNFFSANLSRLLPSMPIDLHEQYYFDFMTYRALAVHQSQKADTVTDLITEGNMNFMSSIRAEPRIFCTFHLGSYRSLMGFMIREGLDFALLLDQRTYQEQGEDILRSFTAIKAHFSSQASYFVVNVEKPGSLLSVFQHVGKGRSLITYLDGNTGMGGIAVDNPSVYLDIAFLGQPFRSRKGVALLSYLCNRPIIPAISYYANGEPPGTLWFGTPIPPPADRSAAVKDSFVERITKDLYNILEDHLRIYPLQWEPWLYVHKFLDIPRLKNRLTPDTRIIGDGKEEPGSGESALLTFNHQGFGLFKIDDQGILFEKNAYQSYVIDRQAFDILSDLAARASFSYSDCQLSQDSFGNMIRKGVFTSIHTQSVQY